MKILIRRWIDDPTDTMIMANNNATGGIPANSGWEAEASRRGADNNAVILFSKAENLYSHNTTLTAKEINTILKSKSIISLNGGEIMIFLFLRRDY